MALISCYECGSKVSTNAIACPNCGAPPRHGRPVAANELFNLCPDNEVKAKNGEKGLLLNDRISETGAPQHTHFSARARVIAGVILTATSLIGVTIAVRTWQTRQGSEVTFVNSAGATVYCTPGTSCALDAESRGFVKHSDAVAGLKVDWTAGIPTIMEARGTAAEAGIRKWDILVEIDGNQIREPFAILKNMSKKLPGEQLKIKVLRGNRVLEFAYGAMGKDRVLAPSGKKLTKTSEQPPKLTIQSQGNTSAGLDVGFAHGRAKISREAQADHNSPERSDNDDVEIGYATVGSFKYNVVKSYWRLNVERYSSGLVWPDSSFLFVELMVTNIDQRPLVIPPFVLKDLSGAEYGTTTKVFFLRDAFSHYDKLNPGVVRSGVVVFDVPKQTYRLQVLAGVQSRARKLIELQPSGPNEK
jgi:hypothetical protein